MPGRWLQRQGMYGRGAGISLEQWELMMGAAEGPAGAPGCPEGEDSGKEEEKEYKGSH